MSKYQYKPYGEIFEKTAADVTNRKFNQQEFDEDTGLHIRALEEIIMK